MKKAIIIGATSGIGQEVARILVQQGWRIGIAGRREDVLLHMQQAVPGQIEIQCLDVTKNDAALRLNELIDRLGGMDLFLLSSGVGFQNRSLDRKSNSAPHVPTLKGLYEWLQPLSTISRKQVADILPSSVP
jgi:NADP-dependent 3-hydroxy acid dehydrogenase YdfG